MLGVVMTFSASAIFAEKFFHDPNYFLKRQMISTCLAFGVFLLTIRVSPDWLMRHSRTLLLVTIVLLILVQIPGIGRTSGGARRWIRFFSFTLQPSEFAKISVCVFLADYLARRQKNVRNGEWKAMIGPMVVLGLICGLIIIQPDLGSVVFISLLTVGLFFLAGIPARILAGVSGMGIFMIGTLVLLEPYRFRRITAFVDPWKDPQGSGYQIIQSFVAFALGGWKGVGLGASSQKLFYLPQSYTDFIYSIIGEELGFVGSFTVLVLYFYIFLKGMKIAKRLEKSAFKAYLAYGLTLLITFQAFINLMVATGMIPTKGLPLPFLSYGGSALIFNMAAIGLLIAVDRTRDISS